MSMIFGCVTLCQCVIYRGFNTKAGLCKSFHAKELQNDNSLERDPFPKM